MQCAKYGHVVTQMVVGGVVLQFLLPHNYNPGPEGERLATLSPVGTLERRGLDTYSATVTRTTGNHGDVYTCMASNGASSSTRNYTISAALAPTNVTWEQITPSVIRIQ